ncbi:retrotransposon protein, putative, ty1-copia subclass, partial [Tanacetum coccineum]
HAMLKLHEETLPKKVAAPALHAIRAGKGKKAYAYVEPSYAPKPNSPPPPKKDNPAKEAICHHCGEVGHWRRNYPTYLIELLKKKHLAQGASTSGSAGNAILRDGVYEIEMSCSNTNDSSIPCRIMSRQGANYFVTFTDDFSRYGYVYLLKHKHEVFETFKVFQKEVENQLEKTIKSLRSDCSGEYMSQEFLDHLKEHWIISHRTPPNTPQHNGVLERRNRTLLDMVCSMMSQTTLPKSFWDYAPESVARILNMVPTKKVDKTPYEIWHGQAPKMSYLKVWGREALVKRNTLTKPKKLEPRSFKYQEASGSLEDLEIIQEEDTHPSIDM